MTLTVAQPAEDPKPNVGSAMAELLTQVPTQLAEQIRDAWSADLLRMFNAGLAGGRSNTWNAIDKAWPELGLNEPKPATPSRPKFQVLLGGAS